MRVTLAARWLITARILARIPWNESLAAPLFGQRLAPRPRKFFDGLQIKVERAEPDFGIFLIGFGQTGVETFPKSVEFGACGGLFDGESGDRSGGLSALFIARIGSWQRRRGAYQRVRAMAAAQRNAHKQNQKPSFHSAPFYRAELEKPTAKPTARRV